MGFETSANAASRGRRDGYNSGYNNYNNKKTNFYGRGHGREEDRNYGGKGDRGERRSSSGHKGRGVVIVSQPSSSM